MDTLLARAVVEGVELGGHARGGTEAAYSKVRLAAFNYFY